MIEPAIAANEGQQPQRQVHCQACQRLGFCRLGIEREQFDPGTGTVRLELCCPPEYEGGPGVAHGGWTAAALDEALGLVPILHGCAAVTGRLEVVYRRPVPIGRPLVAHAGVESHEGRRWYVRGCLELASSGAELAVAHGVWVERTPQHYERHRAWLADQDAVAGPASRPGRK